MNRKSINYLIASSLLVLSVSLNALQAQKPAATKKITASTVDSKVTWIGKKPGGEHNGYVKVSAGELDVNNNELKGGTFTIDLNSIVNLDLKDEGMNGKLVGHLKSADFFDVAKYPTAKFVITKVTKLAANAGGVAKSTHKIEGDLTMKDITRKISFDASVNVLNGKLTANSVPFTIDRTQWGVNYQSKSIFAELKDQFIYDDITLAVELVTK